ncbi:MAG TPA: 50S ribosomal protein L34e [Candidatus Nanoarchaeia archaeon]|nr:50S ribosomal protein L34e [Candidatus Nanoarchaeia archaeon]
MPAGKHKSGRYRKIFVRTPGSKVNVHYRERKPSIAKCGSCKKPLAGIPRERPAIFGKLPKTARRPERPYGGALCSRCTRELIKQKARSETQ